MQSHIFQMKKALQVYEGKNGKVDISEDISEIVREMKEEYGIIEEEDEDHWGD